MVPGTRLLTRFHVYPPIVLSSVTSVRDLSDNQLETLPSGIFDDLGAMAML